MMKKRLIVCGTSRSGTSLLYTLLTNAIDGIRPLESELSALSYPYSDDVCLTKRPNDCFVLERIFSSFPEDDVRVIFSIRDPRDVICSVHADVPHDYFIGFQNQYFVDKAKGLSSLTMPGLWAIYQAWIKIKDDPRVLTVKYEDLVASSDLVAESISEFFEVDINFDSFNISDKTKVAENIEVALNGVRKIDAKSKQVWKKHPQRIWTEFTSHKQMHEIMEGWGYELTPAWFLQRFVGKLPI